MTATKTPAGAVRHFLRDDDLSPNELIEVLDLADKLAADRFSARPLEGPRSVAVIFDKSSTRTRVSFGVGIAELGGYPLVIDAVGSQMGRGESIEDTARVLTRQCSAIVWRTSGQDRIEAMAAASTVPVVNALTDSFHPCQLLADLQTVRQRHGRLAGLVLTYLGDGANNMAHSYLLGCTLAGMHVRIGTPQTHRPRADILARAQQIAAEQGGSVTVTSDPVDAVTGADVVATDTWVSMGMEDESDTRKGPGGPFQPFQVNDALMGGAADDAIFLHCLPAYRGYEVSADVIDGPHSVVWDESENRLHVQKAVISWLMEQSSAAEGDGPS